MELQKVKQALEHCIKGECNNCPNVEELGSGETVCVGRLLPKVFDCITDLEAKLAEKEKTIQAYEKIVEQKDEEISFANRDKTYIVKQLNDPKSYVSLEDYKRIEQQLEEKEKEIEALKYLSGCPNDINEMVRKVVYRDEQLCKQYDFFQKQLEKANQDKIELLEKVRSKVAQLEVINDFPEYCASDGFESCQFKVDDIIVALISELKGE